MVSIARSFGYRRCLPFAVAASMAIGGTAFAANGIKAAYVEEVIPAKTFFGTASVLNSIRVIAPTGSGMFGITSITLTNFDTSPQQVFLFAPVVSGSACVAADVIGGMAPQQTVYVPPQQTLHLTYPTPLVLNPNGGIPCFAAEVTTILHGGSVQIGINGVMN